jgi:hypothetical protein
MTAIIQDEVLFIYEAWQVENGRNGIALFKGPECEFKRRVITDDIILHQSMGYIRGNVTISHRRIARLGYDHQWLRVAMSHAADLDNMRVGVFFYQPILYRLKDLQSAGCPAAGSCADHDDRHFAIVKFLNSGNSLALY